MARAVFVTVGSYLAQRFYGTRTAKRQGMLDAQNNALAVKHLLKKINHVQLLWSLGEKMGFAMFTIQKVILERKKPKKDIKIILGLQSVIINGICKSQVFSVVNV
jgi:hypothetical protein